MFRRLLVLLIPLAVLLVYANTWRAPFVFDDRAAIVRNPTIQAGTTIAQWLNPPRNGSAVESRPIVNVSLALNYAWSGTDPWSYHATNVIIHALGALVLFGIVRRTLTRPSLAAWRARLHRPGPVGNAEKAQRMHPTAARGGPRIDAKQERQESRVVRQEEYNRGPQALPVPSEDFAARDSEAFGLAWTIALLWALHPLLTESVTSVVQRTESLAGLIYLFVVYTAIRGIEAADTGSRRAWLAGSVLAAFIGMATKETVATAPLLVLIYDRSFGAGSFRAAWRRRKLYYAGLSASWIIVAALLLGAGGARGTAAGWGTGMPVWNYLLQQARAVVLYLKLSLWPHPLIFDYGNAVPASWREVIAPGLLVVMLLACAIRMFVRSPRIGFVPVAFFLLLAPSSSIVPLAAQTMAEHRMYLPLALVVVAAVLALYRFVGVRRAVVGCCALAPVLAWGTAARNRDYQSELALWKRTAAEIPENPRAQINFGSALLDTGDAAGAAEAWERAKAIEPALPEIHSDLCVAYARLGRLEEAIAEGKAAVALAPESVDAAINLANAYAASPQFSAAIPLYERALRRDAQALDVRRALADTHRRRALAYAHAGDRVRARDDVDAAVELDPQNADALFLSGNLFAQAGDLSRATDAFRRAVQLRPTWLAAQNNLGNALLLAGNREAAIAAYRQALRLSPNDASIQENLARAEAAVKN